MNIPMKMLIFVGDHEDDGSEDLGKLACLVCQVPDVAAAFCGSHDLLLLH